MRASDIYGKLFNFTVEFYCLIILCVKNLGVCCDSALCGVSLCSTRRKVPLHFPELGPATSPPRNRLSDLYSSGPGPQLRLALPSGALSAFGCLAKISVASHHQTSLTASCCPVGGDGNSANHCFGLWVTPRGALGGFLICIEVLWKLSWCLCPLPEFC